MRRPIVGEKYRHNYNIAIAGEIIKTTSKVVILQFGDGTKASYGVATFYQTYQRIVEPRVGLKATRYDDLTRFYRIIKADQISQIISIVGSDGYESYFFNNFKQQFRVIECNRCCEKRNKLA